MVDETFVLRMPNDSDLYLAALRVVEAFIKMAATDKRWRGTFYLEDVSDVCTGFIPDHLLKMEQVQFITTKGLTVTDADVRIWFDKERAYRLSFSTKAHAIQSFGIMMGCEPPDPFLEIPQENSQTEKFQILVTDIWHYEEVQVVKAWLQSIVASIRIIDLAGIHLTEVLSIVQNSEMVIGEASAATYLAAGLGKSVVELYPVNGYHRGWLSKYGRGPYYMVPTPSDDLSILRRALETAWHTIQRPKG